MRPRTVLSMEQALSMPYATMRFVQLGWRVIRIEATPRGNHLPGDPNRYIGDKVAGEDQRSYFIAPNVGKETISLNLKSPEGRGLLKKIIKDLHVDIFCCNTIPLRHKELGIDYESLSSVKEDIIWASISAMGSDYPNIPGYDPALQAMAGFMEVTGFPDSSPMLSGIPLIDLKAGDEVYANVLLALVEKAESGKGRSIDVSMLQAAASWLVTTLPLLDFDCDNSEVSRCGNEHRKFIPVNVYPSLDGFIFIAIGNDIQWQRLVELKGFESLHSDLRSTNDGRHVDRAVIHKELAAITKKFETQKLQSMLTEFKIPHAPIQTIQQVRDMEAIDRVLTKATMPDGKTLHLPPLAVEFDNAVKEYPFAPHYNQHTESILKEINLNTQEVEKLKADGTIPNISKN